MHIVSLQLVPSKESDRGYKHFSSALEQADNYNNLSRLYFKSRLLPAAEPEPQEPWMCFFKKQ